MRDSEGSRLALTVALITVALAGAGWWGFETFVRVRPEPAAPIATPPSTTDAGVAKSDGTSEARIVSVTSP
jgi:hypothetical protein